MAKREAYAGTISKVKGKDLYMGRIQLGFKPDGKPNRKAVYAKPRQRQQKNYVCSPINSV